MDEGRAEMASAIMPASAEQLPELVAFAALCPDAPHWPVAAWQSFLEPPPTGGALRRVLFTLRERTEIAGVIAIAMLGEVTELELLLVRPLSRRRGLGRALAAHWFEWALQTGAHEAVLEVRASNAAAQELYRTLGFTTRGVRARYYNNPPEDALLLHCDLAMHAKTVVSTSSPGTTASSAAPSRPL